MSFLVKWKSFSTDAIANENWEKDLLEFSTRTYLPVCKIPASTKHTNIREQLLTAFENILIQQARLKGQMITAVKYLISEAMDNIAEHSLAKNGWIMVQSYPQKGYIDICIADTGSGILGSYKKTGNALYIYTNELEQITPLKTSGWKGTLLALQIPAKTPENFNYTTFLE